MATTQTITSSSFVAPKTTTKREGPWVAYVGDYTDIVTSLDRNGIPMKNVVGMSIDSNDDWNVLIRKGR